MNAFTAKYLVIRDHNGVLTYDTDLTKDWGTYLNDTVYVMGVYGADRVCVDTNKIKTIKAGLPKSGSYLDLVTGLSDFEFINYIDKTIPVKDVSTNRYFNRIEEIDPFVEQWDVDFTSIVNLNVVNDSYRKGMLDDLRVTIPQGRSADTLIPFVNGVFHQSVSLNDYWYILDGFANIRISGKKNIQFLDTSRVGGHTFIPFTQDMIAKNAAPITSGCYLTLPADTLKDKTVMVVLDGYLFWETNVVRKISDTVVRLNLSLMDWPQMFWLHPLTKMKSDGFGDYTQWTNPYTQEVDPVPAPTLPNPYPTKAKDTYLNSFLGKTAVSAQTFLSEDFVLSRLLLPNSGLIVINHPKLFKRVFDLKPFGDPVHYTIDSDDAPRGILRYNQGLVMPYTVLYSYNGHHQLFISDPIEYKELYRTAPLSTGWIPALAYEETSPAKARYAQLTEFYGADLSVFGGS